MPEQHQKYMSRCLQLAQLGQGQTYKNPMVGAILVYNDEIIGEGYHEKYGEAHAEVNCLRSVSQSNKHLISQSTLYVNLEPCNHKGKTPPCSHAIVEAGIQKVVIGTKDYNPIVHSKGVEYLKKNNVLVETNILTNDCLRLNKIFFTNQQQKRPYVKLKWAQSANGLMGHSEREIAISGQRTVILNHKFRTKTDAILVGYQTAVTDKPELSARHWQGQQPIRTFIDWNASIPKDMLIKEGQQTLVLNLKKDEQQPHIKYLKVEKSVSSILETLFQNNINSVLIEGGSKTLQMFIDSNLWDEAIVLKSTKKINGNIKAQLLGSKQLISQQEIDTDIIYQYSNSPFLT